MALRSMTFVQTAVAAFPRNYRGAAQDAAEALSHFVDSTYRQPLVEVAVLGRPLEIPSRIHFIRSIQPPQNIEDQRSLVIECLFTRSTDGYARQIALKAILESKDAVVIPFVVLLAGEYVLEIINDIVRALPTMDRDAYANFVRENRPLMRRLRARATSYWDRYYRSSYPERTKYPGLAFLHELERWAA